MFHYFQLLDANNTVRIDSNAFMIIGANMYVDYFLEPFDLHKLNHWVYEKCETANLGIYSSIMEDEQFNSSVCIKKFYNATSKTLITGVDPDFKYPGMYHGTGTKVGYNIGYGTFVLRCAKMTYRDTPCKTEEESIKEEENLIRVKIGMIDNDTRPQKHIIPPITLPIKVSGVYSPYPTVVIVCIRYQMQLRNLPNTYPISEF